MAGLPEITINEQIISIIKNALCKGYLITDLADIFDIDQTIIGRLQDELNQSSTTGEDIKPSLINKQNTTWRYQAVFGENENDFDGTCNVYTICEVYLDADGKLEFWTESEAIAASGETIEELTADLQLMLKDISTWQPIHFDSLEIGMTFEKRRT